MDNLDTSEDFSKFFTIKHFPFSQSISPDDAWLEDCSCLEGKTIVVTEKMDGENTNIYPDFVHARSTGNADFTPKLTWSRSWVRRLRSELSDSLPQGWRICGENLFAEHSVVYQNLPDYFLAFMIVDENKQVLSWSDTLLFCELLNLYHVPVLAGPMLFNEKWLMEFVEQNLWAKPNNQREKPEGFVVRNTESFLFEEDEFQENVVKFVGENFKITSGDHWMHGPLIKNGLAPRP